jgi:ABC-type transporter Mla MlaB component
MGSSGRAESSLEWRRLSPRRRGTRRCARFRAVRWRRRRRGRSFRDHAARRLGVGSRLARPVLAGDLDVARSDEVGHAGLDLIASAEGGRVVLIDLIDVPFIDSTGLGALIALQNVADAAGLPLALPDPSKRVTQV